MIEIPFSNGNSYKLKNTWEELSADEYKAVLKFIVQHQNEEITLHQLRLQVFFLLSGLRPRLNRNPDKADLQAENITRMAHQMCFMMRVDYENTKSFSNLSKASRGLLEHYLPSELDQTPEVRWADKAVKTIRPDLVFARNLIPTIGRRRHILNGYIFEVKDRILTTSLTTAQFIDAQTICTEIEQSGSESLLNLLVAILYMPLLASGSNAPRPPQWYNAQEASQEAKQLDWLDPETKKAIYINFNAIQTYLCTRTKYAILFNAPATTETVKKPKHNLGLGSMAYSLMKSGYGDIENSNLVKFFEIMYSDLVTNVMTLHKQGHPIDKIAEMTGLTIFKINQIL